MIKISDGSSHAVSCCDRIFLLLKSRTSKAAFFEAQTAAVNKHLEKPVLSAARALNSFHDVCVSANLFVYEVLPTAVLYMCIFL